jgi:hypothetical protein
MNRNLRILKWSLLTGSLYFLGVATAHMLGTKLPLLFIYYNVPSYAYQDRIISFLAFGWAAFFFTASRDPQKQSTLVNTILVAGAAAVLGLAIINLTTDFHALDAGIDPRVFWMETAGMFFYWLWLVIFYFRAKGSHD